MGYGRELRWLRRVGFGRFRRSLLSRLLNLYRRSLDDLQMLRLLNWSLLLLLLLGLLLHRLRGDDYICLLWLLHFRRLVLKLG